MARVNGGTGYLVELACETDFVAKASKFIELADKVADAIAAAGATTLEAALAADLGGKSVQDAINDEAAIMGEKVELRKVGSLKDAAVDAYIANRKSNAAQYKAAVEKFVAAKKAYNESRTNILKTYKSELEAAKTAREAAIAAATTDAAKLAANTAYRTAVAAATSKRDAAIVALGVAPAAPATPLIGARPTPPVKPEPKASKSS